MIDMRTQIIAVYKKYEAPFEYVLKFIMGLIIFISINSFFTSISGSEAKLARFPVVLLAAILTAITPPSWVFVLMWVFITVNMLFFSLELSVLAGLLLLCVILFYTRVFPKESIVIVFLLICFKLKIPYFVPLFSGLFFGVSAVGGLIIGTALWHGINNIKLFSALGSTLDDINVLELPQQFADNYKLLVNLYTDDTSWIHIAVTLVIAFLAVLVISKFPLNYSMEIGLGMGSFIILVAMIMGVVLGGVEFGMPGTLFSIAISTLLAFVCKFFYVIVDYSGTERLSFNDDDYIYYVKAVPKIADQTENDA